ncbi:pyruvate dehydrogenase E1 component, alpha subunit domain protein [Mycobacteroides abscessus 1948]|uniref:Pyruvate dehydrogenase E1 component, alpha subunit domain protein n=1 Tax=Mycobacteroides abscessus 1948 TaxID=1299323 RepID=A0A829QQC1_9MYCO|nr:pyruvate dehydrogenase E1 component, alpha subunit domain protein [Mycobacteroides abscessus 1948]
MTVAEPADRPAYQAFLPADSAVQFLDPEGRPVDGGARYPGLMPIDCWQCTETWCWDVALTSRQQL